MVIRGIILIFMFPHIQGEEGDRTVDMALREPERFVAKPQREGGGRLQLLMNRCVHINQTVHCIPR